MTRSKTPALVGAALAIIAFFFVGLFPAMAYGGYAGHLLAGGIVPERPAATTGEGVRFEELCAEFVAEMARLEMVQRFGLEAED